jgi:hypothetical protein
MYFVLGPLNLKHFTSKVYLHNSNFWLTLIHQNHTIYKEHTPKDTTIYVSYDLIHHQNK